MIGPREASVHLNLSAQDELGCDHGELQTLDHSDGMRRAGLLHSGC